mmetsp:Transcript_47120/g.123661  ORF Transcript_47120/g.123661 Transcript_47120/m.123661 type:complete len:80 (+) Transcript_47120:1213-1452(+)
MRTQGRAWCARPWADVASKYTGSTCFMSAYVPSLLEAYGIAANSTDVTYVDTLGGFNVAWALGAQLYLIDTARYAMGMA